MAFQSFVLPVRSSAALLVMAWLLAACGGGLWIGIGDVNDPPHVSLVAPASAAVGQTARLAAAASDDEGVSYVTFYRLDDNGNAVLLGNDSGEPYEWDAVMPNTSAASVRFLARAVDSSGRWTDSAVVSVSVQP